MATQLREVFRPAATLKPEASATAISPNSEQSTTLSPDSKKTKHEEGSIAAKEHELFMKGRQLRNFFRYGTDKPNEEIEDLVEDIEDLEHEIRARKAMNLTAKEYKKIFYCHEHELLTEEEKSGEAFVGEFAISALKGKQDAEWEREERDRQFDFAEGVEGFLEAEAIYEYSQLNGGEVVIFVDNPEDM